MRQMPLQLRLAEHAVFSSFHVGPHAAAVASLQASATGQGPSFIWLWGRPGSGRSHLLQATVAAAAGAGRDCAYLPLGQVAPGTPEILEGLDRTTLLALDDFETVAGQRHWERALLLVYERLRSADVRLLVAAAQPPRELRFALPDLASRAASAAVFQLPELNDMECVAALQKRAAWRGLELPEDTARYLLARVERRIATLCDWLDRLDQASLAAQRRLTVPFVRSVLDAGG
jgi:DnaA family protein